MSLLSLDAQTATKAIRTTREVKSTGTPLEMIVSSKKIFREDLGMVEIEGTGGGGVRIRKAFNEDDVRMAVLAKVREGEWR